MYVSSCLSLGAGLFAFVNPCNEGDEEFLSEEAAVESERPPPV